MSKNNGLGAKSMPRGPRHTPTIESRVQLASMAGSGLTMAQMSALAGISHDTITKFYKAEIEQGRAAATLKVANTLFQQAIGGSVRACIFWLERARWYPGGAIPEPEIAESNAESTMQEFLTAIHDLR